MKHFITQLFSGTYNSKLGIVILGLFGVYSAMVATTIIGINERKIMYNEMRSLTAQVVEKETEYLSLSSSITMATAFERGYIDAQVPLFIHVTPGENIALR